MSDPTLGTAQIPVRAVLDELDKDLEKARGKVESVLAKLAGGFGKGVQTMGKAALGGAGVAIGAIVGVGAAVGKLAADAAPLESIGDAFAGLSESAGTGADDMLAALKRGSAGMVSQRDLMKSFNQAASLVSLDFAKQLPEAMQYLGKVSAATGEDMSFLMDSLVKGVGRVSPAILDNLQIQVTLSEATAKAAEMFGVEADALTKTQQQAGMMAVTLEKLAANTEAMPDATESAAAKMAQMKATIQDTKDEIGLAFVPVLDTVMGVLGQLAERFLPVVTEALETIAPIVEQVAIAFGGFVDKLLAGEDPLQAIRDLLADVLPPEMASTLSGIVDQVAGFIEQVQVAMTPIMEWIGQNVELEDVLIALAIAIASVVIPAIWGVIAAAAPVIAAVVGLIAIVAALRWAWEHDLVPLKWIIEAIGGVWSEHGGAIKGVIEGLVDVWENVLLPAFQAGWAWIQEHIMPLLKAIGKLVSAVVGKAFEVLAAIWENVVLPGLKKLWEWIDEKIMPVFRKLSKWIGEKLQPAFDGLGKVVDSVTGWIGGLADTIANLSLPDWLTPGSPTPFELGLRGIEEVVQRLARADLPELNASLRIRKPRMIDLSMMERVARPAGAGGASYQIIQHFGTDSVRSEQDIYRLGEKMEHSLELRGIRRNIG